MIYDLSTQACPGQAYLKDANMTKSVSIAGAPTDSGQMRRGVDQGRMPVFPGGGHAIAAKIMVQSTLGKSMP